MGYTLGIDIGTFESKGVLVDDTGLRWGIDLVRNDPALQGRPLTLYFLLLKPEQLENLCGRYRMALFGREQASRFGLAQTVELLPRRSAMLRDKLASLNCAPPLQ